MWQKGPDKKDEMRAEGITPVHLPSFDPFCTFHITHISCSFITGLLCWESPIIGGFPAQQTSNSEVFPLNAAILWLRYNWNKSGTIQFSLLLCPNHFRDSFSSQSKMRQIWVCNYKLENDWKEYSKLRYYHGSDFIRFYRDPAIFLLRKHFGNESIPKIRHSGTFLLQAKLYGLDIVGYIITVTSHDRRGVSNHKPLDFLSSSLFRLTKKETSKVRIRWLWNLINLVSTTVCVRKVFWWLLKWIKIVIPFARQWFLMATAMIPFARPSAKGIIEKTF